MPTTRAKAKTVSPDDNDKQSDTPASPSRILPTTEILDQNPLPETSRPPSPTFSKVSYKSTCSVRQRTLAIKLAAAEKLAAIERKKLEIEERLIRMQAGLEIAAIENNDDDDQNSLPGPGDMASQFVNTFVPDEVCFPDTKYTPDPSAYHFPGKSKEFPSSPKDQSENQVSKYVARHSLAKDLPTFSGAPEEWLLFYSQLKLTTKLCAYTDEENVSRLAKCLRGEARDAVYCLLMCSTNLEKIIETLKLRFGRPECIIDMMLAKIKNMRDIRHDDMSQLLKYATDIQNIVAAMISTDQINHLNNPMLIREVLGKLPSSLKYQWGFDKTRKGLTNVTLEHIAEWLIDIAKATVEFTPTTSLQKIIPTTSSRSRTFEKRSFENRGGKYVSIYTSTSPCCLMCKSNHDLADCTDFQKLAIDDRWKFVTERKLCFSCLSARHQLRSCRKKTRCGVQNCQRIHHSILHSETTTQASRSVLTTATDDDEATSHDSKDILLKVVRVMIRGNNGDFETSALLDEGAAVSLIDESLAARAGIDGPTRPLRICGARDMTTVDNKSKTVSFNIRGHSCVEIYKLHDVHTVKDLKLPVTSLRHSNIVKKFPYMTKYIADSDLTFKKVELLIGQDNIDLIVTREVIKKEKNAPMISKTKLGYVVHGTSPSSHHLPTETTILNLCSCTQLDETLRRHYRMEDFGVKQYPDDSPRSRDDKRALDIMRTTTRYVGNRWETGLLWRDSEPSLPDSYNQALVRLQGIKRKMAKLPQFAEKYQEKINDYLQKGYAKKLDSTETKTKTNKTWYLPHFAVFNPNKPTKLRFVLDAAAKSEGKSLNDFLLPGPDYLNSLPGVLLGFRCHQYAIIGDIQEMFHQAIIIEEDRQAQRFLWLDGEYQMNVMIFGAVCSPSSAQYVKNVNAERFKDSHPRAVEAIVKRHYMDDFIDSVASEAEAIQLVDDVTQIHKIGGFNMTSFMSNSKAVLHHLPIEKLSSSAVKVISDTAEPTTDRVLGIHWNHSNDNFTFNLNLNNVSEELKKCIKRPTKREVLKLMMSVFDPLGFLLFVTMTARIILQDVWKSKIGWDDEINKDLFERWRIWLDRLSQSTLLTIPRWFLKVETDLIKPVELHIFCDASSRAFACVSYVRSTLQNGDYHVTLAMARGRVAPLKVLSIPRLELQAALLGARMTQALKKKIDLTISKVIYWSDSKTVLSWIRSDAGRFKPFVAHRISEITELTSSDEWRWVPSHLNHADDATRESDTKDSARWINGPDFLRQAEELWPVESTLEIETNLEPIDPEVKTVLLIETGNQFLPDIEIFSNYWRLIRATAWILRLRFNLKNSDLKRTAELTATEIEEAEILWWKESQRRFYSKEISCLKLSGNVQNDSPVYQLTPILDSKCVMRVNGRIDAASVCYDTKQPVILNPKDRFTRLLMHQYHKDAAHVGRELVLNNLRKRYWITNGRSAVKSIWNDCQECKNRRSKPIAPLMGQLPTVRLETSGRAFTYTGLDYFGPVTVKVGRHHKKRYGALFTCLTVRAVHLEVVDDLSTSSAIMALRRFIARRGYPKEIWTDNATTFRGADNELKRAVKDLNDEHLRQFFSIRRIQWKFICPNSPHHGGCWERMVRSVKTTLKTTLRERFPSDQTLQTLLAEAEHMINNRPLTYVPLDHQDELPLTPNHFIFGGHTDSSAYPVGDFSDRDLLKRTWRESQRLSDLFWKRWIKEYLPTLTKRGKWFGTVEPLKVDDLVIICDDSLQRNLWPKGIITKVYPGTDGQVRVADVKTNTGTYKRPVTKLARLDVRPDPNMIQLDQDST